MKSNLRGNKVTEDDMESFTRDDLDHMFKEFPFKIKKRLWVLIQTRQEKVSMSNTADIFSSSMSSLDTSSISSQSYSEFLNEDQPFLQCLEPMPKSHCQESPKAKGLLPFQEKPLTPNQKTSTPLNKPSPPEKSTPKEKSKTKESSGESEFNPMAFNLPEYIECLLTKLSTDRADIDYDFLMTVVRNTATILNMNLGRKATKEERSTVCTMLMLNFTALGNKKMFPDLVRKRINNSMRKRKLDLDKENVVKNKPRAVNAHSNMESGLHAGDSSCRVVECIQKSQAYEVSGPIDQNSTLFPAASQNPKDTCILPGIVIDKNVEDVLEKIGLEKCQEAGTFTLDKQIPEVSQPENCLCTDQIFVRPPVAAPTQELDFATPVCDKGMEPESDNSETLSGPHGTSKPLSESICNDYDTVMTSEDIPVLSADTKLELSVGDEKLFHTLLKHLQEKKKVTKTISALLRDTFTYRMTLYEQFPPSTRSTEVLKLMPMYDKNCGEEIIKDLARILEVDEMVFPTELISRWTQIVSAVKQYAQRNNKQMFEDDSLTALSVIATELESKKGGRKGMLDIVKATDLFPQKMHREQPFLLVMATDEKPKQAWVIIEDNAFLKFDIQQNFHCAVFGLMATHFILNFRYVKGAEVAYRFLEHRLLQFGKEPKNVKYKTFVSSLFCD